MNSKPNWTVKIETVTTTFLLHFSNGDKSVKYGRGFYKWTCSWQNPCIHFSRIISISSKYSFEADDSYNKLYISGKMTCKYILISPNVWLLCKNRRMFLIIVLLRIKTSLIFVKLNSICLKQFFEFDEWNSPLENMKTGLYNWFCFC